MSYIQNITGCCYPLGYWKNNSNGIICFDNYDCTIGLSTTYTIVVFTHFMACDATISLKHTDGTTETLMHISTQDDTTIDKNTLVKTFYAEKDSILHLNITNIESREDEVVSIMPLLVW